MKILTLNCGSSTVKYTLFEMPDDRKLCYGLVDKIGRRAHVSSMSNTVSSTLSTGIAEIILTHWNGSWVS